MKIHGVRYGVSDTFACVTEAPRTLTNFEKYGEKLYSLSISSFGYTLYRVVALGASTVDINIFVFSVDALRKRRKNQKEKKKKEFKMYDLIKRYGLLLVLLAVMLSACSPATPAPVAAPVSTETPALCSLIVPGPESGMSMTRILEKLGMNYTTDDPILLIDGARGTKSHMPQPGEVISLEVPLANCTGPVIIARQMHFSLTGFQTFEISGFQSTITADRVNQALVHTCELTRWAKYGLRFDGDIVNGGCGYATAVQSSFSDGSSSCTTYATFSEAYDAIVSTDLANLKWLAITSEGTIVDSSTTVPNYCPNK